MSSGARVVRLAGDEAEADFDTGCVSCEGSGQGG